MGQHLRNPLSVGRRQGVGIRRGALLPNLDGQANRSSADRRSVRAFERITSTAS